MSNTLKIMFIPMDAVGHINSCLGIANAFTKHGHEVIFTVGKDWVKFINEFGYKTDAFNDNESNDQKTWSSRWAISGDENISPAENEGKLLQNIFSILYNQTKYRHDELKQKIETIKPDIIILDVLMSPPCVETSGIPYIYMWSANPIRMYHPHCPPPDSGYPTDSDPKLWNEFQTIIDDYLSEIYKEFSEWFKLKGAIRNSDDFLNTSPYLNIYIYPEYLDYTEIAPISKNWYRLDHAIRDTNDTNDMHDIPEEFLNTSDKKIFLSLGSMGSVDLKLMNKLIQILADYPAKIIISKGVKGDEILLKSNMWGKNSVKQLKILPLVDLVISHGGNNTVVESLYFGKPLIIIPLFGDQPDNAQRLVEKKLGIRLDRYNIEKENLFDAIDKMLNPDESVKLIFAKISEELQKSTRIDNLVKLIEKIALEKRSPL